MGDLSRMTGTPWHVNRFTREEGDKRRHKSRCKFYNKASGFCRKRHHECRGSAHCKYYDEAKVVEELKSNDSAMTRVSAKTDISAPKPKWTSGIKSIPIDQIIVPDTFITPSKNKIDKLVEYYNEHKRLDKPIVVSYYGDKYFLEDKYLRYYVARQLGLKKIDAKLYSRSAKDNIYYPQRCKVIHKTYGEGTVTKSTKDRVYVRFEKDGSEKSFDADMCFKQELLKRV